MSVSGKCRASVSAEVTTSTASVLSFLVFWLVLGEKMKQREVLGMKFLDFIRSLVVGKILNDWVQPVRHEQRGMYVLVICFMKSFCFSMKKTVIWFPGASSGSLRVYFAPVYLICIVLGSAGT